MNRYGNLLWLSLIFIGVSAPAQVTTDGSTSANVIPYFKTSTQLSNSPIAINGNNVGVGTMYPEASLQVSDPNNHGAILKISDLSSQSTGMLLLGDGFSSARNVGIWRGAENSTQVAGNWLNLGGYSGISFSAGNATFGAQTLAMTIVTSGNVGIGTTNPTAKLDVNGSINLSGSGAGITFPNNGGTQTVAWTGTTCGGDYAESVDVSGDRKSYEPGDVLVIDPGSEGSFLKSAEPYSTSVTGIYSTKPGLVGRRQLTDKSHMQEEVPMAMVGIVPTKVSAENGSIKPGDLLVASSLLGHAMKGTDRSRMLGAVIGKALGHLDSGTGVIEVVVTLQ